MSPWGIPIPPSPDGSRAIIERFAERGIAFMGDSVVQSVESAPKQDGRNMTMVLAPHKNAADLKKAAKPVPEDAPAEAQG